MVDRSPDRPYSPGQSDSALYKLAGVVINSVTGEPIPHALVQLHSQSQQSVLSDGNGAFEFNGLRRSFASVTVRKPGFFTEQEISSSSRGISQVQIGPDAEPVVFRLVPAATLVGTVTGSDGAPVELAPVQLFSAQVFNGRKRFQQVGGAQTNDDGSYRLGSLRPGTYILSVGSPPINDLRLLSVSQGYPSVWYYPGTSARDAAAAIELRAGQTSQADLTLPSRPVYRLAGAIVRPPGTTGVWLQLTPASGEPFDIGFRLLPNNRFETRGVSAGTYLLEAHTQDQEGHEYSAHIPINVSSNLENVVVTLSPSPAIPVVINTEFTKGETRAPGAPRRQQLQVMLQQLDPPYRIQHARPASPDTPDLEVRNITPGRYLVQFPPNSGTYVQSASCGTVDLLREPLLVASGMQVPPIVVNLKDDTGTLTVKASGSVPESGAKVLLLPDARPTQPPTTAFLAPPLAQSMNGGGVVFTRPVMGQTFGAQAQLAPGEYTVLALDQFDQLEYANPEVMRRYLPKAAHATVYPNASATVVVDVIHAGD